MSFDIFGQDAPIKIDQKEFNILVYRFHKSIWLDASGEIFELTKGQVKNRISQGYTPVILGKKQLENALNISTAQCLDILELFAFTHPACFVAPLPQSLAAFFKKKDPSSAEEEALFLLEITHHMLTYLAYLETEEKYNINNINHFMALGGWNWAPYIQSVLAIGTPTLSEYSASLKIWDERADWEDSPPPTPPLNHPIEPVEILARMQKLLGHDAEEREAQKEYALKSSYAMQPKKNVESPNIILAEAGTGTGKTLGYIAPASLWAEKNSAPIWISTYTRNLQRQLNEELNRLYPDIEQKKRHVVVRKGRENYFCWLNYEDILNAETQRQKAQLQRQEPIQYSINAIGLGLIARWLQKTQDGDLIGGDFPAWLIPLLGKRTTLDLSDTRGECIYSACPHWKKCFIEHIARRSHNADIIVSNHALSLIRAAQFSSTENHYLPSCYIFDEGHHLFDVADNVFSAHLTGMETTELRRWILGNETNQRKRFKGLRARIEELIASSDEALNALTRLEHAARQLPSYNWRNRLSENTPNGRIERFLSLVRKQVQTYSSQNQYYDSEAQCKPLIDGFDHILPSLSDYLHDIIEPTKTLIKALENNLDQNAETLDSNQRGRIEACLFSLDRRIIHTLSSWVTMIEELSLENEIPDGKISWFSVERRQGTEFDIGMHTHLLDPTEHLVRHVFKPSSGVLITSATLRNDAALHTDDKQSWNSALNRIGAQWLDHPVQTFSLASPFDWKTQSKLIVINDVNKNDLKQVSSAFRELFLASNGGGLGLFTAINRLQAVYRSLHTPLSEKEIQLYAQHVSNLDTGTLTDIFRQDINSCLLGTDAIRDGIDIPGHSLRLFIFDRVPWPRRTILYNSRKKLLGGSAYEDSLVVAKLRQAWGRMIRKNTDKAVFIMLDGAMPSRFKSAFPPEVTLERMGLAQAISEIKDFF